MMKARRWSIATALVGAVLSALLPAAPALAEGDDRAAATAGEVVGIDSVIDETTPMYYLKLRFTVDVTRCPAALDTELGSRGINGIEVCGSGAAPGRKTTDVLRPVFGLSGFGLNPNGLQCDESLGEGVTDQNGEVVNPDIPGCQIRTFVRDTTVWPDPKPGSQRTFFVVDDDGNDVPFQVEVPDAPRWIGVGDGYTSKRTQTSDACFAPSQLETAACSGQTLEGNDRDQSWINTAVINMNASLKVDGQSIPTDWRILGFNVATDVISETGQVKAADLASPGHPQLGQITGILTEGGRKPSWDWIGVSAGLVDAGIPQAVRASYNGYSGPTNTIYPWNVSDVSQCPALPLTVAPEVATGIDAGLRSVIATAKAASAGVRVVLVQYPFLTERTSTVVNPGTPNLCAQADTNNNGVPDNRDGVNAVNAVVGAVASSGLSNVYALDLRAGCPPPAGVVACGFGEEPTGTGSSRAESYLQLTRPWGYPYPSRSGAEFIGRSAGELARSLTAGPPAIDARVVKVVNGQRVRATPVNGWYGGPGLFVEWVVKDGEEGAGGVVITPDLSDNPLPDGLVPMRPGNNVIYRATAVDAKGQKAEGERGFPYDPHAPQLTATVAPAANTAGWHGAANTPTVTFDLRDPAGVGLSSNDAAGPAPETFTVTATRTAPNATTSTTQTYGPLAKGAPSVATITVPITQSGTYVLNGTGRDRADVDVAGTISGNPAATARADLKVDLEAPTVTVTPSTTAWTNQPVTVTYRYGDTGGSGVDATTATTTPSPVTSEGRTVVSGSVRDRAGNPGSGSATVRIDTTEPLVSVRGPVDGASYTFDGTGPTPPTAGCTIVDQAPDPLPYPGFTVATDASGADTCTISTVRTPTADGASYTVTASGADRAGNRSTATVTYTVSGFLPIDDGRMTVGGTHTGAQGVVTTSGTLRCNGSPNRLGIGWAGGAVKVDWIDSITCIDDPAVDQEQPKSLFDTLMGVGSGTLDDGTRVSVEFTFVDAGEPGVHDAATVVVRRAANGQVLLDSTGSLTGGNFQAHLSQGQGANNSGCANGPNGKSKGSCWTVDNSARVL